MPLPDGMTPVDGVVIGPRPVPPAPLPSPQPPAPTPSRFTGPKWAAGALLVLLSLWGAWSARPTPKPDGPKPPAPAPADPKGELAVVYSTALSYTGEFGEAFRDASAAVKAGKLKTNDDVTDAIEAARKSTAKDLGEALDRYVRSKCDASGNIKDAKAVASALATAADGIEGK